MEQARFEVGRSYATRSICDHDCIVKVTIAKRTAKTVTTSDGKTFRPRAYLDGSECIQPWGSYSMAPVICATDTKLAQP